MGSQPGGATHSPIGDWIAVTLMVVGACALAAGIITAYLWLAIAGTVIGVGAAIAAWAMGIMSHTEEYEMGARDDTA